jgi:hypothetical protein
MPDSEGCCNASKHDPTTMRVFFPIVKVIKRNSVLKALVVDSFGQPSSLIVQHQARPTQYLTPGRLALFLLEPGNCVTARDLFDFIQLSYLCSRNSVLCTCPIEDLTLLMEDLYHTMCYHEVREWEMVASQLQRLAPRSGDECSISEGNEQLFSSILEATRLQMDENRNEMLWLMSQFATNASTKGQYCTAPKESAFSSATPNQPYCGPLADKDKPGYSANNPDPISHHSSALSRESPSVGVQSDMTLTKEVTNSERGGGFGQPLVSFAPYQVCPRIPLYD